VARYLVQPRARVDLFDIWQYTDETWGTVQADRYVSELEACFRQIAEEPQLGRRCDHIRPGYWHIAQGRHVVFYRRDGDIVVIVRVLHDRMLPERHFDDDDF
jgi:toxin ParE1/3/4